jgi:hypothetical protein
MITLQDFGSIIFGAEEVENDEYLWTCYGKSVANSQYWNGNHGKEEIVISVVYDTRDGEVYEMQAWDGTNNRQYRWIHPDYKDAHDAESARRGVDTSVSYDDNKFIDLELEDDIIEKATAIYSGFEYDTHVSMSIDLDDDLEIELYRRAHKHDMTLNQFVEHLLRQEIGHRGGMGKSSISTL